MNQRSSFAAVAALVVSCSPLIAHAQRPGAPPSQGAAPLSPALPEAPRGPSAGVAPPGVERVTLAQAVERAIVRNSDVGVAVAAVRRAEALIEQARAPALPTLSGNLVYTRLDSPRTSNGVVVVAGDQLNANLALGVPIIVPQRWVAWQHASENADVSRASLASVRRSVAVATARAYLAVVRQRRIVEVDEVARDTARAQFEFAHARLTGGVGNRLDEARAAQELATSEALVASALAATVQAREALGVLAGGEAPLEPADGGPMAAPPTLGEAIRGAEQRRSDVRAFDRAVAAAERVVRDNWADYSPYLTGQAQAFYQTPATLTSPQTGWQAQLALTVPFYDGGLRYGLAKEREAQLTSARVQRDGVLRQARSEARAADESVRRADEALERAREAARLAAQSRDLATIAYRAGATTNIEVIDAERAARDAETRAAIADDAARQARLDMLAASGAFP